jgi:hypothetical protein
MPREAKAAASGTEVKRKVLTFGVIAYKRGEGGVISYLLLKNAKSQTWDFPKVPRTCLQSCLALPCTPLHNCHLHLSSYCFALFALSCTPPLTYLFAFLILIMPCRLSTRYGQTRRMARPSTQRCGPW